MARKPKRCGCVLLQPASPEQSELDRAGWLSIPEFATLAGISRQAAFLAARGGIRGKVWRGSDLIVRTVSGHKGGKSGLRYEVLLSSLPEALQKSFSDHLEGDDDTRAITAFVSPDTKLSVSFVDQPPAKFIAASRQTAEEERRYRVLRHILITDQGSRERGQAIRDASHHHDIPARTIRNWLNRIEKHGGDLDALGRKRPADAGRDRVKVYRTFDRYWRQAGYGETELDAMATWFRREVAAWWQSPVQRAGWKRVRLEVSSNLRWRCTDMGFDLPRAAFAIPRSQIEPLRFHRAVDVMRNDAKRFDDMKPRIRRDNSRFQPMEQIVMDVKPLDCVLLRPDGSEVWPKLIGFMDTGTHRLFCRIIMLPKGEGVRQEHVTDAFLDMVQHPDWGFPQQLYCDNGSEYKHFDLIREAIKMIADEGARVIIRAKPYSGASKPIESKFSVIDRQITALMAGYAGSDRMNKKTQTVGKSVKPYPGSIEQFEAEYMMRLHDFHHMPIGSGPFKDRSPMEIYHGHLDNGWRPVRVDRMALDCAFAKQLGARKVDRGAITIGPNRFRHPELAAFAGHRVQIVKPYRRDAEPLANLPGFGWVMLEPEMLFLPGDLDGAREAGRVQRKHQRAARALTAEANMIDPAEGYRRRIIEMPGRASPWPLFEPQMSDEAQNFAGARIEASKKRENQPSEEQRLIERQMRETLRLEKKYGRS